NDGADDDIGHCLLNGLDALVKLGRAKEDVRLPHALGPQSLQLIFDDLVDAARPHIVSSDQEEFARLQRPIPPAPGGNHLLVWGGAGIDYAARLLETLVSVGIKEQVIELFDNRLDALAAG